MPMRHRSFKVSGAILFGGRTRQKLQLMYGEKVNLMSNEFSRIYESTVNLRHTFTAILPGFPSGKIAPETVNKSS